MTRLKLIKSGKKSRWFHLRNGYTYYKYEEISRQKKTKGRYESNQNEYVVNIFIYMYYDHRKQKERPIWEFYPKMPRNNGQ